MQLHTSLFISLLPLLCSANERLGTPTNFESVGSGRIFTSDPQPHVDRARLLAEATEEESVMETVGEGKFAEPITRRLRRVGDKKRGEVAEVRR